MRFCVWASYVHATAREDTVTARERHGHAINATVEKQYYTRSWKLDAFSGMEDAYASSGEEDLRVGRQCNVTPRYHRRARALLNACTGNASPRRPPDAPRENVSLEGEVPSQADAPGITARSIHCR
ncbi:uncharacterized protein SCHCODRAFT_02283314 [Schizophyllum commune H4-8]|uniref:uncharacterized protein n=1 Tax=Schizophyllum commune (strain H4-8 / FGSC 9210) TaxID=578458 RepID=UPI0021605B84|nr:uncharacterized protein SCHCODRAFT_02283314 [Schizophyllum commune H4-8]KAI5892101.1 hypothetical protein SCHCODRAFT_02283314 [Schizophyllum commune H4-8]